MGAQEFALILKVAVAPLATAFALAVLIRAILRDTSLGERHAFWPGVLVVGAGMLAGQFAFGGINLPTNLRVVEGWQWLQAFAIAALLLLPLGFIPKFRPWLGEAIRIVLFAAFVFMAVRALPGMERSTALAWMIGAPIVAGAWSILLARFGPRAAGRLWPCILAVVCTASAGALFLLQSARLSFLSGSLAAAVGGMYFGQFVLRRRPSLFIDAGGVFPILLLAGFFLVHGIYVDDVPLHVLAILLVSPAAALIGLIPPVRRLGPIATAAIQIGAVLAVLTAAILPAYLNYETDPYANYR